MITKEEFIKYCNKNNIEFKKIPWINYYINNNWSQNIFISLCNYGYLKTAKWFFNNSDINIHMCNESAFIYSCKNGYLKIAKWLFNIENINIHMDKDFAFILSCLNNHLKVAEWLCSLCDDYSIEIENGKIKYKIKNCYERYLDEKDNLIQIIKKLQLKII